MRCRLTRQFLGTSLTGLGLALGCGIAPAAAQPQHIVSADPLPPEVQLQKFHVPPGFEVQLVAAEPQIDKPINLAFDLQGRLLVTQSVEYPFPVPPDSGRVPRDAVVRLTDADGDGRAERAEKVVEGLNIPLGITQVPGGLLVFSIPSIYYCTDRDGDGRYETKQAVYSTFGQRDTHGLSNSYSPWVDGWVYGCHGFANESTVQGKDGQPITMQSGNTYRMRPDGSRIEYFTHGQVNPFGMCFDPRGDIYTADCHSRPLYMLLRGAWYPSFGRPHDGLGYGPEMAAHSHDSTGIAGIAYYAATHFPPEYHDTLFIGNPITHRINHDKIEQHGSTWKAIEQPDFLSCDDPWFRPVDVHLGPDGALYIADFYNRIIGHYEVALDHPGRDRERGRIWRVVYKGLDGKGSPPPRPRDLETLTLDELLNEQMNPNLVVRVQATNVIVSKFGPAAAKRITQKILCKTLPTGQAHGLWALERLGALTAEHIEYFGDRADPLVRLHLAKIAAERPRWDGSDVDLAALMRKRLKDSDPFVKRAAADALARPPAQENIEPLLALWKATPADDLNLIHTVRMALRDQLETPGAYPFVLEKWTGDGYWLRKLADVSRGAKTPESAKFTLQCLQLQIAGPGGEEASLQHAFRYLDASALPAAQDWADEIARRPAQDQPRLWIALHRAHQERGSSLPPRWKEFAEQAAQTLLSAGPRPQVLSGIELVKEWKLGSLHAAVAELAKTSTTPLEVRVPALEACTNVDGARSVPVLAALLTNASEVLNLRERAILGLAIQGSPEAQQVLLTALASAPERLAVPIATGLALRKEGGEKLLAAVAAGKAAPRLLQDRTVVDKLRQNPPADWEARVRQLTEGLPPVEQRILALLTARRDGFGKHQPQLERGQKIFTQICAKCHQLNGQGNKIGPQLDGIGLRGVERILEDLLDPSRNVDQAFRQTTVTTTKGQVYNGLVLREEGQVLLLADLEGKEVRIPLSDIDERQATRLSPMPGNLSEQIPEPEFYDLLTFLLGQQTRPASP